MGALNEGEGSMTPKMLFSLAALAGVVAYCFHRGTAASAMKREAKPELHRWEGEGGSVPQAAARATAPPRSHPGNGAAAH
jgi:hypothetical protein